MFPTNSLSCFIATVLVVNITVLATFSIWRRYSNEPLFKDFIS
jgi:hypothetical protein